ncbi:hypothetical protein BGZ58_009908 [Dissophora ornata]|nr:hypothetical protein BGZ58_009908 [Dissophora ornata]
MSPANIYCKAGKLPCLEGLGLTAEVHQRDTDSNDLELAEKSSLYAETGGYDELASTFPIRRRQRQVLPRTSWKHRSSFSAVRRQLEEHLEQSSGALIPSLSPGATTTMSFISPSPLSAIASTTSTTSPSSTPSTTSTYTSGKQSPLSSLAVQLILGGLVAVCIIAIILRCHYVNRQHHAIIAARRRSSAEARAQARNRAGALVGTHLVPTNERTLAARLNMYQAQSGARTPYYPYQQEPLGAAAGGNNSQGPLGSVNSFVAPSYEQDVSPPPFMLDSGKPPAYAEALRSTPAPPTRQTPLTSQTPSTPSTPQMPPARPSERPPES